jgi:F-type H+-transporting ATPase subunit epsilon
MFHVVILSSKPRPNEPPIYEGNVSSLLLPGAEGEFEILDFHKPIISRLKEGYIVADSSKELAIKGGIVKMERQNLVAVVDL